MRTGLIIIGILTLLIIAGALPVKNGTQTVIFTTPVFILAASALALSLTLCSVRRLRLRQIPFLLCHLGVILILVGVFARHLWEERYNVAIPLTRQHRAFNLQLPDGTARPLGFGLSASDFQVEFYDTPGAQIPRHYEVQLEFALPDQTTRTAVLAVNHPVEQNGWWFHLSSYDTQAMRYVVLAVKRDPGRPAAMAGIWLLLIGIPALCFKKRNHPDAI